MTTSSLVSDISQAVEFAKHYQPGHASPWMERQAVIWLLLHALDTTPQDRWEQVGVIVDRECDTPVGFELTSEDMQMTVVNADPYEPVYDTVFQFLNALDLKTHEDFFQALEEPFTRSCVHERVEHLFPAEIAAHFQAQWLSQSTTEVSPSSSRPRM